MQRNVRGPCTDAGSVVSPCGRNGTAPRTTLRTEPYTYFVCHPPQRRAVYASVEFLGNVHLQGPGPPKMTQKSSKASKIRPRAAGAPGWEGSWDDWDGLVSVTSGQSRERGGVRGRARWMWEPMDGLPKLQRLRHWRWRRPPTTTAACGRRSGTRAVGGARPLPPRAARPAALCSLIGQFRVNSVWDAGRMMRGD
eukprot:gene15962-biopygen12771